MVHHEIHRVYDRRIPFSFLSFDCTKDRKRADAFNWHDDVEMLHVRSGRTTVVVGEERISAQAGDTVVINPNIIHSIGNTEPVQYHCLIVNRDFLNANYMDTQSTVFLPLVRDERLKDLGKDPDAPRYGPADYGAPIFPLYVADRRRSHNAGKTGRNPQGHPLHQPRIHQGPDAGRGCGNFGDQQILFFQRVPTHHGVSFCGIRKFGSVREREAIAGGNRPYRWGDLHAVRLSTFLLFYEEIHADRGQNAVAIPKRRTGADRTHGKLKKIRKTT